MILVVLCLCNILIRCCLLGPPSSNDAVSVTFDELVRSPADYFGKLVKITTEMKIVQLDYEGLWIVVQDPEMVIPQSLFVKANEKWFHFPLDLSKKTTVELEGYFNLFSFFNSAELLTPYSVLELNATSVNLVNESCKTWINQISIVDLNKTDMEEPSVGAGKVCLKPHGGIEKLHSDEHSVEIINVVQNCVTLRLKRGDYYEEHYLCDGISAYIPSGTPHMLINHDKDEGCYIFVHAVVDTSFGH